MLFRLKVQGGFAPRSKATSPRSTRVFLPKVQGYFSPRYKGISPQGTRVFLPKVQGYFSPRYKGASPHTRPPWSPAVASFDRPQASTRGGVRQWEGVPGWPAPRGVPACWGLLPGQGARATTDGGSADSTRRGRGVWRAETSGESHEA